MVGRGTRSSATRFGRVATSLLALIVAGCVATAEVADVDPTTNTTATITTTTSPAFTPTDPTSTAGPTTALTTTTSSTATTAATSTSTASTSTTIPVHDPSVCPPTGSEIWEVRPASDLPAPDLPAGWAVESVGTTVLGRDITAWIKRERSFTHRVMVIGGVHGNEPVSPPTVRGLVDADVPDDVEVWLVPAMNADGTAAGTRCNANGVDLNRNFSWGWRADTGGPGPISEPETQAMTELVERLQPDLVVWVHQPYGYAASIGATDPAFEQAWAAASGVRTRPGTTQHGGGESWTAFVAERPSMLIEIDTWGADLPTTEAHRAGFEAVVELVAAAGG